MHPLMLVLLAIAGTVVALPFVAAPAAAEDCVGIDPTTGDIYVRCPNRPRATHAATLP